MPTARSIQSSTNINRMARHSSSLALCVFTFRKISSHNKAVLNKRNPQIIKSLSFQLKPWPSTPVPMVICTTANSDRIRPAPNNKIGSRLFDLE